MSRTATAVLALVVGLAAGIPLGGRMMPASSSTPPAALAAGAGTGAAASAVPAAIGAEDVSGPYEVVEGWPQDLSTLPGTRSGRMAARAESLPRARIVSFCLVAASCRRSLGLKHGCFPRLAPTCSFRLRDCRGATRTRRRRQERAALARTRRKGWKSGAAHQLRSVSSGPTRAGNIPSWS